MIKLKIRIAILLFPLVFVCFPLHGIAVGNANMKNQKNIRWFVAVASFPCNMAMLCIQPIEDLDLEGKSTNRQCVVTVGDNNPLKELHADVLIQSKFKVKGYYTGKVYDNMHSECIQDPEFYVLEFEAHSIRRCSTYSARMPIYEYTGHLPKDRFVDEDYGRATLPTFNRETCGPLSGECSGSKVKVEFCGESGDYYCCRLDEK